MAVKPWVRKRLEMEWEMTKQKNTEQRMIAPLDGTDFRVWRGRVRSKKGEVHEFEVRLESYPLEPPQVEWLTPISHPNIEPPKPQGLGRVDIHWFTNVAKWNPQTSVNAIIEGLLFALNNPDPNDPLLHPQCLIGAMRVLEEDLSSHSISYEESSKIRVLLADAKRSLDANAPGIAWARVKKAASALTKASIDSPGPR